MSEIIQKNIFEKYYQTEYIPGVGICFIITTASKQPPVSTYDPYQRLLVEYDILLPFGGEDGIRLHGGFSIRDHDLLLIGELALGEFSLEDHAISDARATLNNWLYLNGLERLNREPKIEEITSMLILRLRLVGRFSDQLRQIGEFSSSRTLAELISKTARIQALKPIS